MSVGSVGNAGVSDFINADGKPAALGEVKAQDGHFVVNLNGKPVAVDINTVAMLVGLRQSENINEQVAAEIAEAEARNTRIDELTQFMAACRTAQSGGEDDDKTKVTINGVTKPISPAPGNEKGNSWAEYFGLYPQSWSDIKHAESEGGQWDSSSNIEKRRTSWDANINNISSQIDMLNIESEKSNNRLQDLMQKYSGAFEKVTSVMDANANSIRTIISNL